MKDSISVRIYCDSMSGKELEKIIGIKGTKVWGKGDLMRNGKNRYRINGYTYTVELGETDDLSKVLNNVIELFYHVRDKILYLNCKKILTIGLYVENGRKIYLDNSIVSRIYNLGIDLDIDIIYDY